MRVQRFFWKARNPRTYTEVWKTVWKGWLVTKFGLKCPQGVIKQHFHSFSNLFSWNFFSTKNFGARNPKFQAKITALCMLFCILQVTSRCWKSWGKITRTFTWRCWKRHTQEGKQLTSWHVDTADTTLSINSFNMEKQTFRLKMQVGTMVSF